MCPPKRQLKSIEGRKNSAGDLVIRVQYSDNTSAEFQVNGFVASTNSLQSDLITKSEIIRVLGGIDGSR